MIVSTDNKYLDRSQAAEYLGVKESTLAAWASSGRYDLPMVKVGRRVRYRTTDLDRWMAERTTTITPRG